jgi:serine/threonine protein kinase
MGPPIPGSPSCFEANYAESRRSRLEEKHAFRPHGRSGDTIPSALMSASADSFAIEGDVIAGRFRVGSRIAVGSMGYVVAARHVELDEPVAIKLLHPNLANPRFAARFIREARNAVRIKSEHVPRFIDAGRLPSGLPYLAMEYLEGRTLAKVIADGKPIAITDAVDYVLQACEAVAAAHIVGIVHRDLKPSNLFLTTRLDGSPLIKVLDFGISRVADSKGEREDEGLTLANVTLGSHDFKAPEQFLKRDLDARCDVWALGAILYTLLTLRPPFFAETGQETIRKILQARPDSPCSLRPEIKPELESVILRCLQENREARPATVGKLALFLQLHASARARDLPMRILAAQRRGLRDSPGQHSILQDVARDIDPPEIEETAVDAVEEAEPESEESEVFWASRPRPIPAAALKALRASRGKGWRLDPSRPWVLAVAIAAVLVVAVVVGLVFARRAGVQAAAQPANSVVAAQSPSFSTKLPAPSVAPPAVSGLAVQQVLSDASSRSPSEGAASVVTRPRPRSKPVSSKPSSTTASTPSDPWGWER